MAEEQAGSSDRLLGEVGEPRSTTWKRRARTIPTMLGMTIAGIAFAPLALTGLAVADLVRGHCKLPQARLYLFALRYLYNDSVEILLAPVLWTAAGFGRRLHSTRSQQRHAQLQRWSLRTLAHEANRLMGIQLEVTGADRLLPAPAIVLCRHVSVLDSSLPSVLIPLDATVVPRGVITADMLLDPGFDLIYGRLGSVFINSDRGSVAQSD